MIFHWVVASTSLSHIVPLCLNHLTVEKKWIKNITRKGNFPQITLLILFFPYDYYDLHLDRRRHFISVRSTAFRRSGVPASGFYGPFPRRFQPFYRRPQHGALTLRFRCQRHHIEWQKKSRQVRIGIIYSSVLFFVRQPSIIVPEPRSSGPPL